MFMEFQIIILSFLKVLFSNKIKEWTEETKNQFKGGCQSLQDPTQKLNFFCPNTSARIIANKRNVI